MNQINSLIIEGNLVKDCEIVETVKGFKVGKMTITINRWSKNANGEETIEVSYFDIEMYGVMIEKLVDKCKKGVGVRVVGRLKQERWKDETGKNHSKVVIVCEHIEFKSTKE